MFLDVVSNLAPESAGMRFGHRSQISYSFSSKPTVVSGPKNVNSA